VEEIELDLNAEKLPPGVAPPQSLRVRVDDQQIAHMIRINGPRLIELGKGPLEAVARTLLRVSTGALAKFEQEEFQIMADGELVRFSTPGAGLIIELPRAGLEELACRLIVALRNESGSTLESEQQLKPLHEIPVGKLINNQVKMEVEDIELL